MLATAAPSPCRPGLGVVSVSGWQRNVLVVLSSGEWWLYNAKVYEGNDVPEPGCFLGFHRVS